MQDMVWWSISPNPFVHNYTLVLVPNLVETDCVCVVFSAPRRRVGSVERHPTPGDRPQLQRHSVHLQEPHRQHQWQRTGHHRRSVSLQDSASEFKKLRVNRIKVLVLCVQVGSGPPTGPWPRRRWTQPSKLTASQRRHARLLVWCWRELKAGRRRSTSAWCRTTDWRTR